MWKPETDNQTLPRGVPPIEGQQEKYNIKTLGCEVKNVMKFLKKIFEEK